MSLPISRAVIRQQRVLLRRSFPRNASTTTEAAKEKTSEATSKASEGLSRVSSSAGSAISKAGSSVGSALGRVGGRTGRVIGFVSSLIPPTIYYSKVGLELGKIIFEARKMSPPNLQTFQSYMQPVINAAKNPTSIFNRTASAASNTTPNNVLSSLRNTSNQQLAGAAVVAAEIVGFFTVGEMIGKLKVVGYRSGGSAEH
ncbi:hypothetical protein K402DRAFT_295607, partial [Aulographum hederae CBS 113979]